MDKISDSAHPLIRKNDDADAVSGVSPLSVEDACAIPAEQLETVFLVFIRYGFRKTSMDDVARAMGVSRQAIYKRFGTKETLFSTVVDGVMHQSFAQAIRLLDAPDLPLADRLMNSCDALAGHFVDHLRASPHSVEVIALVNQEKQAHADRYDAVYTDIRIKKLMEAGVTDDAKIARDMVDTMTYAAKGLLHTARNNEEFRAGFAQVIRTLLPNDKNIAFGASPQRREQHATAIRK